MRRQHTAIFCAGLALSIVLIWSFMSPPAQAHDAKGDGALVHCKCAAGFPPTEDAEVAKIYATAHIVVTYLEKGPPVSLNNIDDLVNKVENALED